jgi:hypothetical protein
MNNAKISGLFDDAAPMRSPTVTGKWFPIRLSPDLATGELFNIGVAFVEGGKKGGRIHVKMLESARSFKCLFGASGVENVTFLINVVAEHLRQTRDLVSPSPQVSFGPMAFASGDSVDQILARLYATMVTLRHHNDDALEELSPYSISSQEARRNVIQELYWADPAAAKSLVREKPLEFKAHGGRTMALDVPLRKPRRFGTIASAHYRKEVYVSNNLNTAMRDMLITRDHLDDECEVGGIFILRAPTDERYYTESWQRWIDEEVEKVRETLFRTSISVREGASFGELRDEIRAWA